MIPVDSSVWVDYFRGKITAQTDKLDSLPDSEFVAIVVELGGRDTAIQAAKNFRTLRGGRVTVGKIMDTVIATKCIESGLELLHSDRDFEPFARHLGLRIAA